MKRYSKWYEFWNPSSGLLGGFIFGALVNAVVIGACIFLAGCGGGGSEDPQADSAKPDVTILPVTCSASSGNCA